MLSLGLTVCLQGCQPTAGPAKSAEKPLPPAALEHFKQAQKYLQEKKLNEALAEFQQVTQQAPESPLGHLWIGKVYLFQKNFPQAEAEFKKVLAQDPKNYSAMILLGRLYSYDPKRLDLAVDYLKQGLALSPDNLEGHFDLGRAYALKGDRPKAVEAFNFIFFKEHEYGLYHYEVARILEGWGEKAVALQQYQRALVFNPTLTTAQEAVQRLEGKAQAKQPFKKPLSGSKPHKNLGQ